MNETEKDVRSDIKPRAPLPWVRELDDVTSPQYAPRRCRVIRSVGGPVVAYDIGIQRGTGMIDLREMLMLNLVFWSLVALYAVEILDDFKGLKK